MGRMGNKLYMLAYICLGSRMNGMMQCPCSIQYYHPLLLRSTRQPSILKQQSQTPASHDPVPPQDKSQRKYYTSPSEVLQRIRRETAHY